MGRTSPAIPRNRTIPTSNRGGHGDLAGRGGNMGPPPPTVGARNRIVTTSNRQGRGNFAGRGENMGPLPIAGARNRTVPTNNRGIQNSNWNKTKAYTHNGQESTM